MLEILIWVFLFFLGYLIIFFSADVFIDNLKETCEIYNVSPLIIGSLILGIDPEESIASIIASINGLPYIALGNIIGNSIIALTISFAIPAFFLKISFKSLPQFFFTLLYASMFLILIGLMFQFIYIIVGVGAILLYYVYIKLNLNQLSKEDLEENPIQEDYRKEKNGRTSAKKIIFIILSFTLIFMGGELLIISAEQIMIYMRIPEIFFGLVIIAFVTNVEELTLVIKAINKKSIEIGMGGMIGKVMWNLAITFGISAMIIVNVNFIWVLFWNWLVLFVLIMYFNRISRRGILSWKDGMFLILILLIYITINFLTIF